MKTSEIRAAYIEFFKGKGHHFVQSDNLVPEHDPSLLFTGAGMNQFKDQFLGKNVSYKRAVSCQKCFRADDIDEVGRTACHHTFFEMLGNFSFGDYFKREAILWAWEFLTKRLDINPDKLYVSVYKEDDEAYDAWKNEVGIDPSRIYRLGEHDNFWPADAPTKSPEGTLCGPCTEIFYDLGPQAHCPDPSKCDITCECRRYVEIWNLVLQQYQKGAKPGELIPLKSKNIDTGMGLERTAAVLQGVSSNFEIDIFRPIVDEVGRVLKIDASSSAPGIRHIRRIADHVKAVSFLIAENILPSNDGRGYVERRLIRRAMRDGIELGAEESFLYKIVPAVAAAMQDAYPEITARQDNIARVIKSEEERFQTTLKNGTLLLKELVNDLRSRGIKLLPGEEAFRLYDTYGLPLELTENILGDFGMKVDTAGFEHEMARQRTLARSASAMGDVFDTGPLGKVKDFTKPTEFVGYDSHIAEATIKAIICDEMLTDSADNCEEVTIVLDRTSCYGESGGQLGDAGTISTPTGKIDVLDTKKTHGYFLHNGKVIEGKINAEQAATVTVDAVRRQAIRRAHTATHLLHHALRTVLGTHVEQAGSLVAPDRLRFDFSHFSGLTREEMEKVEEAVNANILEGADVSVKEMPIEEARKTGAMALFGEKYGETVRVVSIGDYSKELCGGTHLDKVSETGLFKIVSESSIAAGVRRIEAVTGREAMEHVRRREQTLEGITKTLGTDEVRAGQRLEKLFDEIRELKAEVRKLKKSGASAAGDAEPIDIAGVKVVILKTDMKAEDLREAIDVQKRKLKSGIVVIGSTAGEKLSLIVGVTQDLTAKFHAGKMIQEIMAAIGGKGGGRPDMAQAGGKDPAQMDIVLEEAKKIILKYGS